MKIVKVSALWCPACLITNNNLDKIIGNYPNLVIENLDYDFDEEEVSKYDVGDTLPVLIFINDNDKELGRLIGEKTKEELEEEIGEVYEKEN